LLEATLALSIVGAGMAVALQSLAAQTTVLGKAAQANRLSTETRNLLEALRTSPCALPPPCTEGFRCKTQMQILVNGPAGHTRTLQHILAQVSRVPAIGGADHQAEFQLGTVIPAAECP
jgi:hypothetical protein